MALGSLLWRSRLCGGPWWLENVVVNGVVGVQRKCGEGMASVCGSLLDLVGSCFPGILILK